MAAKATPPTNKGTEPSGSGTGSSPRPAVPPPPKPASSEKSHWLDSLNDVKVVQDEEPIRPKIPSAPAPRDNRGGPERGGGYRGPGGYRDRDERGPGGNREGNSRGPGGYRDRDERGPGEYRGPSNYRVGGGMGLPETPIGPRPRQPMEGGPNRGPRPTVPGEPRPDKFRPGGKEGRPQRPKKAGPPKPPTPPKPKREKIPPPPPFVPTPEQVAQVEARYRELAVPTEFDGIRTQISTELSIPKTAVKKIVKELRDQQNIPSWWELQTYKGPSEELEKIRALYEPLLPLPEVGVHKKIAEELSLKPVDVYQAIKTIRQEMNLPQFNDPALHGLELSSIKKRKQETPQGEETEQPKAQEEQKMPEGENVEQQGAQKEQETPIAQKAEPPEVQEEQKMPVEETVEKKIEPPEDIVEPQGEIFSIETDTPFQKVGDTTEVVPAGTTEDTHASEA